MQEIKFEIKKPDIPGQYDWILIRTNDGRFEGPDLWAIKKFSTSALLLISLLDGIYILDRVGHEYRD